MGDQMQLSLLDELVAEKAKVDGNLSRLASEGRHYSKELEWAMKEAQRISRHVAALEREAKQEDLARLRRWRKERGQTLLARGGGA